jgi:hypothetical protein
LPEDASAGFLPPKNNEFGEGFVEFEIDLARSAVHSSQLKADAVIIFDNNEPIWTNELIYTIDSEAPLATVTWFESEQFILIEASDSGSGLRTVTILDDNGDTALFVSTQSTFIYPLEPREQPYKIYLSLEDNVGNVSPARFYLEVQNKPDLVQACSNNCSSNGVCNELFACACLPNYTEADCSRNLTLEEILAEPLNFKFGYKTSEIRDHFDFEIEIVDTFERAVVDIRNFPSDVEILFLDDLENSISEITNLTFTNNTNASCAFQVKVPRNYVQNFQLEIVIVAERLLMRLETECFLFY